MVAKAFAIAALLRPAVVHDARESSPPTSVDRSGPVVYERIAGHWARRRSAAAPLALLLGLALTLRRRRRAA